MLITADAFLTKDSRSLPRAFQGMCSRNVLLGIAPDGSGKELSNGCR